MPLSPPRKPVRWSLGSGLVSPAWKWAWRNLVFALPLWDGGGGAYDYAQRHRGTATGLSSVASLAGVALDFRGNPVGGTATSYVTYANADPFAGTSSLSGVVVCTPSSYAAGTQSVIRDDGTHNLQIGGTSLNLALWPGGSLQQAVVSHGKTAGDFAVFGFTMTDAGSWRIYVDGNRVATDTKTAGVLSTGANVFQIGRAEWGGESYQGLLHAVMYWSRPLTDAEHMRLASDPFGMFRRTAVAAQAAPAFTFSALTTEVVNPAAAQRKTSPAPGRTAEDARSRLPQAKGGRWSAATAADTTARASQAKRASGAAGTTADAASRLSQAKGSRRAAGTTADAASQAAQAKHSPTPGGTTGGGDTTAPVVKAASTSGLTVQDLTGRWLVAKDGGLSAQLSAGTTGQADVAASLRKDVSVFTVTAGEGGSSPSTAKQVALAALTTAAVVLRSAFGEEQITEWLLPNSEPAVLAWARSLSRLTAQVGGSEVPRIYYGAPSEAPETSFPLVVVQRVGGGPDPFSEAPIDEIDVQFDVWGPQTRLGIADGKLAANNVALILHQELFRFTTDVEMGADAVGLWATVLAGPTWSPDPEGRARYVLTARFGIRAANPTVIA